MNTLFLILNFLYTTPQTPTIIGRWNYVETISEEKRFKEDCPESFELKGDSSYTIFNACYGEASNPVTEKGRWSSSGTSLEMKSRNTIVLPNSFGTKKDLHFEFVYNPKDPNWLKIKYRDSVYLYTRGNDKVVK